MINKVTFAGFKWTIASPRSALIVRLVTREYTRFYNKDSEPKAQVSLLKFPEQDSIFQRHILSKAFCHFPSVRMKRNAFHKDEVAGPQSGAGPALADAGPNARPMCGALLINDFMMSSCSVNRVRIVGERKCGLQH